jgi:2'-5' RNA ligase
LTALQARDDQLIRCFIAIPLPSEIRDAIDNYLKELKKLTDAVKWVKTAHIHLTLKFFGEIKVAKVQSIKQCLSDINNTISPFILSVNGSGCFPNKRKPRVFWLGLGAQGLSDLERMYHWLESRLATIDFEKEKRRFAPHLTLGRVKYDDDFSPLFAYLAQMPFSALSFQVDELALIRSRLYPDGAQYTTLEKFSLMS